MKNNVDSNCLPDQPDRTGIGDTWSGFSLNIKSRLSNLIVSFIDSHPHPIPSSILQLFSFFAE